MKYKKCLVCKTDLTKTSWVLVDRKKAYCLECFEQDEMGWI